MKLDPPAHPIESYIPNTRHPRPDMDPTPEMRALLQPGESFAWVARPDGKVWAWARTIELGLVAIGLLAVGLLLTALPLLPIHLSIAWSLLGGGLFLVVIVAFVERGWYKHHAYGLTQKRLFLQGGLTGHEVTTVNLVRLKECRIRSDSWDRLFKHNTGTLQILTHSDSSLRGGWAPQYVLHHMDDPEKLREDLMRQREDALHQHLRK